MELKEIARRIREGDRDALRALLTEYGPGVYQKAYARLDDADLAREATRRTFHRLVRLLRTSAKPDGWKLLLGAVAEQSIDQCEKIPSEMQSIAAELEEALFPSPSPTPTPALSPSPSPAPSLSPAQ